MATRKRSGGGGGAGGVKGFLASAAMMVLIAAAVVGWWNFNGFKDLGDAIAWFEEKSANMNNCVDSELTKDNPDAQNIVNAHGCIIPKVTGGSGGTAPGGGTVPGGTPAGAGKDASLATLAGLKVAPAQNVNYSRSEWKHWLDLDGNGCDTRQQTLMENGTGVKTDTKSCKVLSGTWVEPYANKTYTDPGKMDLDHIVALSWAAANGGNGWSADVKTQFANDPLNLRLADASENRSKGDKGPSQYLPPNAAFQCSYVNSFISVVAKYSLTIPQQDKAAAEKVIKERC